MLPHAPLSSCRCEVWRWPAATRQRSYAAGSVLYIALGSAAKVYHSAAQFKLASLEHWVSELSRTELRRYMTAFAGYGDLRAPLWFIGMEEGSGRGLEELEARVRVWSIRGRCVLEDLPSYHHAIGLPRHFVGKRPLQRTWSPLLRCLLAWRGQLESLAELRRVQATELGTHGGDSALVELLPLPSPSVTTWPYAELAVDLPELADRVRYRATVTPLRIRFLRHLLARSDARAVVCYGIGSMDDWTSLLGRAPKPRALGGRRCYWSDVGDQQWVVVPHPVAHGSQPVFWSELGRVLRAEAG